jgi:L,D-peptidoglycan transpeptidase YkuD (ErfK/YbiS/YcfS/YnhG family)
MVRSAPFAILLVLVGPSAPAASPVPADTRQMLLSVSAGWDETNATVIRYERRATGGAWQRVGTPLPASLGQSGLAWGRGLHAGTFEGPIKKEGDNRSPAGVFRLREATGYAPLPPAGTRLSYRQATAQLKCVDDPRSTHYNQLVDESAVAKDWASAEEMRRPDDLYRLLVWVGHNDEPIHAGDGSCIFLHFRETPQDVTAGCTAFDKGRMEELLSWLDPAARPVLVQLPEAFRQKLRADWGLPGPER